MKEYVYRKKVRYQSRPAFIAVDLLAALIIIFSGPFIFVVPMFMMFTRIAALSHSQVQYLLPRTEEEIKKQSIMNIIMICLEVATCMLLWLIPSLLLYNRLGNMIRRFPVFIILWILAIVLTVFRVGFDAERHRWAGADEKDISLFGNIRQDVFGHITSFFSNFFLIFLLGTGYCLDWMEIGDLDYQNPVILVLLVVTMTLIFIDNYRGLKAWALADYHEEQENG